MSEERDRKPQRPPASDAQDQRHFRAQIGRLGRDVAVLEREWDVGIAQTARESIGSSIPPLPPIRRKSKLDAYVRSVSLLTGSYLSRPSPPRSSRSENDATSEAERRRQQRLEQVRRSQAKRAARGAERENDRQRAAAADKERSEMQRTAAVERERAAAQRRELEKKQRLAAVTIQTAWRGKIAREQVNTLRRQRSTAAIRIQKVWRGRCGRRDAETQKRVLAEERQAEEERKKKMLFRSPSRSPRILSLAASRNGPPLLSDDDDELSPEEEDEMKRQFDLVDADHSGGLDRLEFAVFWNLVSDTHLSRWEADVIFDDFDVDGAGELTLDEFRQLYRIIRRRETLKRSDNPADAERLRRINSRVSAKAALIKAAREEVARCKRELESRKEREASRRQTIVAQAKEAAQRGKDAREVGQQERLAQIRRAKEREQHLKEVAAQKREIELFIHKAEVKAARLEDDDANLADEFTPSEIRALKTQFEKVDVDCSGDLNRAEFAVFYNRVCVTQLTAKEGEELFNELDVGRTGALKFDDFISVYNLLQRRERLRKDPALKERLSRLDEKLKQKALHIANAKKHRKTVLLEASMTRALDETRRKRLHNQVVSQRNQPKKVG